MNDTSAQRTGQQVNSRARDTLGFDAVIFDMDGVVTRTAKLHAEAWKELFDDFLRRRAEREGKAFQPFDADADYLSYVDGKPRRTGLKSFLAARDIHVPEGDPNDDAKTDTIYGLAKRKDDLFQRRLREHGVEVFASTISFIEALRASGIKTGIVTSSRSGRKIMEAVGLTHLFDASLDGNDASELGLSGKPDPDAFLKCATMLDVVAGRAVIIEDAVSGVQAGRNGNFGLVIGVNRGHNRDALAAGGADIVVDDLGELQLADLERNRRARAAEDISWRIEQEGFDPAREHAVESIFTVGNGYLGVRGALSWPLPISQDDLFIAGIYDRKQPSRPYSEREFLHVGHADYPYTELVSVPFPFRLRITVDGVPLRIDTHNWLTQSRVLDLRSGVLLGNAEFETHPGRHTSVRSRRCASATDHHLLLDEIVLCLENHSGTIEVDASLADPKLAADDPHLIPVPVDKTDPALEVQRFTTRASHYEICIASRTTLDGNGKDAVSWRIPARIGETITLRRYVAVYTSRDGNDPYAAALTHVHKQRWDDFESLFRAHTEHWKQFWKQADVEIDGSPATEQAIRFDIYHLASAADRDPTVSVGARALTGRAYEGHVFWDVEIFMLPFYLHTSPDVARHLLLYRHHTLAGARRRAQELGYRGACYAWESTVTGEDVTPREILLKTTQKTIPIYTGTEQVHVTADIAFGVWRYFDATEDQLFMRDAGGEILTETARYWVSRCTEAADGACHLRGVIGPDEYHHSVNDNAYTNWMARFNLEKAVWAAGWMQREYPTAWSALVERNGIAPEEPDAWRDIAHRLYCPQPNREGVIEQFEGFFDLDDYALPKEERYKAPISRLFEWDRINRLKLIKQADVLMLLFLFPQTFSHEVVAANYRYYEPLTDHGSSLSPSIHAAVAARLGLRQDAENYWRQSLWLDLSNVMGNSALGIHAACMGGNWQALVFGFLGVRFTDQGPMVDPTAGSRLPAKWGRVATQLMWRGRRYPVVVDRTPESP